MNKTIKAAAVGLAGVLALTACTSAGASGSKATRISVVAFSVMETANEAVYEAFQDTDAGRGHRVRAVVRRLRRPEPRGGGAASDADFVHFSLETDMTRLVDEGLVAEDWKDNATNGIATSSVVVFVVREGNPQGIETWDDLVEADVEVVTPEPRFVRLGPLEHPRRVGPRRRQRRHRGRGEAVHLGPARQHARPCRPAPARRPRRSSRATRTCCCPTRTRRSSPSRTARTSTTSSRPDTLLIENPAAVTDGRRATAPRTSWTS